MTSLCATLFTTTRRSNHPTVAENVAYRIGDPASGRGSCAYLTFLYSSALLRQLHRVEPEYIIHLASPASAETANAETEGGFETIVRTTANLLESCRELRSLPRVVYVSSSMVYGNFIETPMREDAPKEPIELYGGFKLLAESLVKTYGRRYGLPFSIVRPAAGVWPGEQQPERDASPGREVRSPGRPVTVTNPDRTYLDFTFVRDLADGIALVTLSPAAEGQEFNLTRGEGRNLGEAVDIVRAHVGRLDVKGEVQGDQLSGQPAVRLDISKARRLLGYDPKFSLEDGLREYIEFARRQNESLKAAAADPGPTNRALVGAQPSLQSDPSRIPLLGGAREFASHRDGLMRRIEDVLASGDVVGGAAVAPTLKRDLPGLPAVDMQSQSTQAPTHSTSRSWPPGVERGDEVLVTDFSFVASASAIMLAGARPVFVDVDESYNMSLERAADRCTPVARARSFSSTCTGRCPTRVEIEAFARRHGLVLIEDAAQAIGAVLQRPARQAQPAPRAASRSTRRRPSARQGGGGAVLTDDGAIAERVPQTALPRQIGRRHPTSNWAATQ